MSPALPALHIAAASADDAPLILALVRELAEYEKLADQVSATEDALRESLFGERPAAEVLIARVDGEPAGFALFFGSYSTFLARPGIYLEDLFVRPAFRGLGIGRALLIEVAALAVSRRCGRVEWSVLDWNEPAIGFYRRLGARPLDDWTMFRLVGPALDALAASELKHPRAFQRP